MREPITTRPAADEYPAAVANYVQLVPAGNLLTVLAAQVEDLAALIAPLNESDALARHAPYAWTIKQVIGHLTDCERVFGYRSLRIARNDKTPLPGFDENAYMEAVDFDRCPISELLEEFSLLRRSHQLMLGQLAADAWLCTGVVNAHAMSTRAVACVMAGHAQHHLNILHKRLTG